MPLPKDFDWQVGGPSAVQCPKCRNYTVGPTRIFSLLQTGIVEQWYQCDCCCWSFLLRYDPQRPAQFIVTQLLTPLKDKQGRISKRLKFGRK